MYKQEQMSFFEKICSTLMKHSGILIFFLPDSVENCSEGGNCCSSPGCASDTNCITVMLMSW